MNMPIQDIAPKEEEKKPSGQQPNNSGNDNSEPTPTPANGGGNDNPETLEEKVKKLEEEVERLKENSPCPPKPVDLKEKNEAQEKQDGVNDNEDEKEGVDFGGTVVQDRPKTYHSQVRDQACTWEMVKRRSAGQIFMNLSGLQSSTRSEEYSNQSTQKIELTNILTASASEEIKAEITGGGASATATASLSASQIKQKVDTYLSNHTFVLVHYIVTISGTITARKDWTVTETWNYSGEKCKRDEPRDFNDVITGPTTSFNVSTTHHVWEMRAPSIPPRGTAWAEAEANKANNELAVRGAWLPELPLPANLPANVG